MRLCKLAEAISILHPCLHLPSDATAGQLSPVDEYDHFNDTIAPDKPVAHVSSEIFDPFTPARLENNAR